MAALTSTTPKQMQRRRCPARAEGSARTTGASTSGTSVPVLILAVAPAAGTVAQGAYYAAGQRIIAALLVIAVVAAGVVSDTGTGTQGRRAPDIDKSVHHHVTHPSVRGSVTTLTEISPVLLTESPHL